MLTAESYLPRVAELVDNQCGAGFSRLCAGLQSRLRGAQNPVVGGMKPRRRLKFPHVLSPYSTNLNKTNVNNAGAKKICAGTESRRSLKRCPSSGSDSPGLCCA